MSVQSRRKTGGKKITGGSWLVQSLGLNQGSAVRSPLENKKAIANGSKAQVINDAAGSVLTASTVTTSLILGSIGLAAGTAPPTLGLSIGVLIIALGLARFIQAQNRKQLELQNVLALVSNLCFAMIKNLARIEVLFSNEGVNKKDYPVVSPSLPILQANINLLLSKMIRIYQ